MTPQAAQTASLAPLEGVRVIDFTSNIAGPFATMILAQLGADVIKVEPPHGDDARAWSLDEAGQSYVHRYVNAGKRSIVLDLKTEDGVATAQGLCRRADVVLQSMRPGVAERLGIDEATIRRDNARILYYDLNGFGAGPIGRGMPGYDPMTQAFAGIVEMNGHDGDRPARCAPSVIDLGTGQWIAIGIMAALMSAGRGRPVGHMETALVDTAFSLVSYQASAAKVTGRRPPKAGSGNPIAAPYQCFHASDREILIAAPSQRLWQRLAAVIGLEHLVSDPRFAAPKDRVANRDALAAEIETVLRADTAANWIERLGRREVPAALVSGLEEAVESPVAQERETFLPMGGVPLVRLPLRADGAALPWRRPAPELGEHTAQILEELEREPSARDHTEGRVGAGRG